MPGGNILSPLGLLIPYALYPLACYGLLVRLGNDRYPGLTWPMALGAGPLLATFVIEVYLVIHPGPGQRWIMFALTTATGMALLGAGRPGLPGILGRRPGLSLVIASHALALFAFIWFLAGKNILYTWDPVCYRLVADRMVNEGVMNARRLILEPTSNTLMFVHPFHGPVYPLLMALNRIFAGTRDAFYDLLPACWYLWSSAWLAGGLAGGRAGWQGFRAWAAAALVFSSYWYLHWTIVVGQSLSVSAFGAFFCFAASFHAAVARGSDRQVLYRWLIAGAALGMAMGVHRINLVLPVVFLLFVHASGLATHSDTRPVILAGILVSLLVFVPYGIDNPLSLGEANPVSGALGPYRATWRAAFEDRPLYLAFRQFFTFRDGLILWGGALITGLVCLWHVRGKQNWAPREKRLCLAVGLSSVILSIIFADLSLIFLTLGMELIVRSNRYRNTMVPFLAFAVVAGLAWRLRDTTRLSFRKRISPRATVILGAAAMWLVLITTLWCFGPPHFLPFTRDRFHKRMDTIRSSDEEQFFGRYPLARNAVEIIEVDPEGFTLLDWMPLLLFTDSPVRNPWLNPGVFPLLDAKGPEEAWCAANEMNLVRFLLRTNRYGTQLNSATGLRNYLALEVSELIHDRGNIQIFRLRDRLLKTIEEWDMGLLLSEKAKAALNGSTDARELELFQNGPAGPGDFELVWEFDEDRVVMMRLDQTISNGTKRHFVLRSFKPHVRGPQRIRFLLRAGEGCRIVAKVDQGSTWRGVRGLRLLRAPLTGQ